MVYPCTLEMRNVIIDNFELKSTSSKSDSEESVIQAAKLLNAQIKNHQTQMSWPPKEEDLKADKISLYIPDLLNNFFTVLISGQSLENEKSKAEKTLRLKDSFAQDVVFSVTNGAIKTRKSVLFPSVVKALCNNTEILNLLNKYGHGISYDLLEEIETDFALNVINEQAENRAVIPIDFKEGETSSPVALMIADNIDNLECTLSGTGTSHRVNSILVLNKKEEHNQLSEDVGNEVCEPPLKKKCKRSLPSDIVIREIPEYYGEKRVGPGELPYVQNLGLRSYYDGKAKEQRMQNLVWVKVRKLKTHPLLLVPDWTGFNIKVRDNMVVLETATGYMIIIIIIKTLFYEGNTK